MDPIPLDCEWVQAFTDLATEDFAYACVGWSRGIAPKPGRKQPMDDDHFWHPWLRINRLVRVILRTRWSAELLPEVTVQFRRALALRSYIQREGWFN